MNPLKPAAAPLAAALAALALTACGEKDEPAATTPATEPAPAATWAGPPAELGKLEVDEFNDYAGAVDERWERSPLLTAAEFARLDRQQAATTSAVAKTPPEGGTTARVVLTLDGLLDDSIRATRYVVELERTGATWRLTSAAREQRCHEGRGHADFDATPCV
jgi:hypothetical protein